MHADTEPSALSYCDRLVALADIDVPTNPPSTSVEMKCEPNVSYSCCSAAVL